MSRGADAKAIHSFWTRAFSVRFFSFWTFNVRQSLALELQLKEGTLPPLVLCLGTLRVTRHLTDLLGPNVSRMASEQEFNRTLEILVFVGLISFKAST